MQSIYRRDEYATIVNPYIEAWHGAALGNWPDGLQRAEAKTNLRSTDRPQFCAAPSITGSAAQLGRSCRRGERIRAHRCAAIPDYRRNTSQGRSTSLTYRHSRKRGAHTCLRVINIRCNCYRAGGDARIKVVGVGGGGGNAVNRMISSGLEVPFKPMSRVLPALCAHALACKAMLHSFRSEACRSCVEARRVAGRG